MKLTCLGTASGIATKTRFHNMVLLESCGHGLLLDGGEPLSTLLIRHGTDLNEIDGMVITHLHSDHAGALPQLIQTMQISRRDKVFQVLMPSEGTHLYKDFLNMLYLFDSVLPFHLKIEGIQCGAEQEIGDSTRRVPRPFVRPLVPRTTRRTRLRGCPRCRARRRRQVARTMRERPVPLVAEATLLVRATRPHCARAGERLRWVVRRAREPKPPRPIHAYACVHA